MKRGALIAVLLSMIGCASPVQKQTNIQGQWVLATYDAAKGYTFLKDGVEYQGRCQVVRRAGKTNAATWEEACIGVLPYLHKVVPATLSEAQLTIKNPDPNSKDDWEVVFLVTSAK